MEIEDLLGVDGRTTSRLGLRGILYGTGRLARTIKATVMGTHRANRGAGTRKSASPKVQCPVPSAPQTYRVTLATSMVEVVRVGPGGLPVEVQGAAQSPKTNAGTTPAGLSGRRLAQPRRDGPLVKRPLPQVPRVVLVGQRDLEKAMSCRAVESWN
jgi:hypothetical protein